MDVILVSTIIISELLYIAICIYMYKVQRTILYQPEHNINLPSYYGFDHIEDHILTAEDNTQLGCWYQAAKPNQPTILYFHGNAGHMGDRVEKMHAFLEAGFGICAPSYRGYGKSSGTPSEEGTYMDARAALQFLHIQGVTNANIILYGESLGSGIAVQLAYEQAHFKLLTLEAPYTSTADRGIERYPFLPVYLLMKDQYDSLTKIAHIHTPVLIFHGKKDTTIPISHGKTLYKQANKPKKSVFLDECDHTNFDPHMLVQHINKMIKASFKI